MSNSEPSSRFTAQNKTTEERLSTHTVGLVALSDFRKRRAEVLEQQEREAREAALSASKKSTPDRSLSATPNNASDQSEANKQVKKKKPKRTKVLVSFNDESETEAGDDNAEPAAHLEKRGESPQDAKSPQRDRTRSESVEQDQKSTAKVTPNTTVSVVPRALTKAALRREAAEREALRKEFLALQEAIKATEIAIPFVFYDGTNIPGGIVRVKKGDFVWVFLDKSRKVGAERGVGGEKKVNIRREWARVGVDDLMLVRGTIIIPHHYDFYFFIMNKTLGPGGRRLFDYSTEAPTVAPQRSEDAGPDATDPLSRGLSKGQTDIKSLEGVSDDPTFTKVVNRRWYQRNKHIYPASVWQEFDPEKDYQNEIRRDLGGNAFFFAK